MADVREKPKHNECPPPGTPGYRTFIDEQAKDAAYRALNGHPILRVLSTVVLVLFGVGSVVLCIDAIADGKWQLAISCVLMVPVIVTGLAFALKKKSGI